MSRSILDELLMMLNALRFVDLAMVYLEDFVECQRGIEADGDGDRAPRTVAVV